MIVIYQLPVDVTNENFCSVFFLPVLLGHIADGMMIDLIFHRDKIVTLLAVWRMIFLPWHNWARSVGLRCNYYIITQILKESNSWICYKRFPKFTKLFVSANSAEKAYLG